MEPQDVVSESPAAPGSKGRGAGLNPANRFQMFHVEAMEDMDCASATDEPHPLVTQFYEDHSSSIITYNDSPDIFFDASLNVYRGCEHGCSYCYARPTHEYLGFSAGLDFESRIMVKRNAPALLRQALESPKWKPQMLAMSGVTDPYQPVERTLRLTRQCLEVLAEFRNPVGIVTKNALVTRDKDLLIQLGRFDCAMVFVSINSCDGDLARQLEPRAASPRQRFATVRELSAAGIPVSVLVAPVIPGLNDHEIPEVLAQAAEAGAQCASYVLLRLPLSVSPVFQEWLTRCYPDRAEKVLGRIRAIRGGKLNSSEFGTRFSGQGVFADQIEKMFEVGARRARLGRGTKLSTAHFRRPGGVQMELLG